MCILIHSIFWHKVPPTFGFGQNPTPFYPNFKKKSGSQKVSQNFWFPLELPLWTKSKSRLHFFEKLPMMAHFHKQALFKRVLMGEGNSKHAWEYRNKWQRGDLKGGSAKTSPPQNFQKYKSKTCKVKKLKLHQINRLVKF